FGESVLDLLDAGGDRLLLVEARNDDRHERLGHLGKGKVGGRFGFHRSRNRLRTSRGGSHALARRACRSADARSDRPVGTCSTYRARASATRPVLPTLRVGLVVPRLARASTVPRATCPA